MVFSRQQMETAFSYSSVYYDKILLVDYNYDSFRPILVKDDEWNRVPDNCKFTEWVGIFITGESYKPCKDSNKDQLVDLLNINEMRERKNVLICNYYKLIQGSYHIVQLEFYPLFDGMGYLFVRDLTKMQNGQALETEVKKWTI